MTYNKLMTEYQQLLQERMDLSCKIAESYSSVKTTELTSKMSLLQSKIARLEQQLYALDKERANDRHRVADDTGIVTSYVPKL